MGSQMRRDTWADVCFKNVIIFMVALAGMGFDPDVILPALPERVGKTRDALKRYWGTLTEFNEVLDIVVEQLGHPWHMVEVGRLSNQVSFGLETVQRWFLKWIFKWVTDPSTGVNMIPSAARTLNQNKSWQPLLKGKFAHNRQIFRITYNDGPKGQSPRSTIEDRRSLLYFVRGVLEAIVPMWPRQASIGHVRYLVVQIPAIELIQAEMPDAEVQMVLRPDKANKASDQIESADYVLVVNGKVYGEVVYLKRNSNAGDEYTGEFKRRAEDEDDLMSLVPAIRMIEDLRSVCARTGESLPLMREGEIYEWPETRLPYTTIEMRWKSGLLQRAFGRLFGSMVTSDFEASARQELETASAHQERADAELRQRLGEWHLSTGFPTQEIARAVTAGLFETIDILTCVLFVDVVGSTKMGRTMQIDEKIKLLSRLMREMTEKARQHGGWYYKFAGDGGIFIFTNGWAKPPSGTMSEAVEGAILTAADMMVIAEQHGVQLRIGIHVDNVTWFTPEEKTTFEGLGLGLDNAKRMEECAPDGRILVSAEAMVIRGVLDGYGPLRVFQDKHEFAHNAHMNLLPGEALSGDGREVIYLEDAGMAPAE